MPGNGPTPGSLLHQLLPQHLPDRPTVWRKVVGGDVPSGSVVWMQVENADVDTNYTDTHTIQQYVDEPKPFFG